MNKMCTSLSDADAVVLKKWARTYRYRWYAWVLFAVMTAVSGGGALWNLAVTISQGGRLGLTAIETLSGSPTAEPLDAYRLLAMASASYIMLATALFCSAFMLVVRKDTRRYRVVLKLLQAVEQRKNSDGNGD